MEGSTWSDSKPAVGEKNQTHTRRIIWCRPTSLKIESVYEIKGSGVRWAGVKVL